MLNIGNPGELKNVAPTLRCPALAGVKCGLGLRISKGSPCDSTTQQNLGSPWLWDSWEISGWLALVPHNSSRYWDNRNCFCCYYLLAKWYRNGKIEFILLSLTLKSSSLCLCLSRQALYYTHNLSFEGTDTVSFVHMMSFFLFTP
jgi:hypothetical protein